MRVTSSNPGTMSNGVQWRARASGLRAVFTCCHGRAATHHLPQAPGAQQMARPTRSLCHFLGHGESSLVFYPTRKTAWPWRTCDALRIRPRCLRRMPSARRIRAAGSAPPGTFMLTARGVILPRVLLDAVDLQLCLAFIARFGLCLAHGQGAYLAVRT